MLLKAKSHSEERFLNEEAFPSNFTGMNPTLLKGVMSTSERSSCCGCLMITTIIIQREKS
jgi:hypothetical protein